MTNRVFITSLKRSAFGKFQGGLSQLSPVELGTQLLTGMMELGEVPIEAIDEVIIGNVLSASHGQNIARQIALHSGLPTSVAAYTLNMVCGSSTKAIAEAFIKIKHGIHRAMIVGGVESMSQAGFVLKGAQRKGLGLGHQQLVDTLLIDGLTDAFSGEHMGITAENVAEQFHVTREMQDQFAYESQLRARKAQESGVFKDEILPVKLLSKKGETSISQDEHINTTTTLDKLAALRPVFKPNGTVTAGNASGINDGAALLCVVNEEILHAHQLVPLAEIVDFAQVGINPDIMGYAPYAATKALIEKTGIEFDAIDFFELNEAFASQSIAVVNDLAKTFNVDVSQLRKRVNPNGGAIALGHPIGASGARGVVTLVNTLKREAKSLGITSLCIGGGMGIALLIKNIE